MLNGLFSGVSIQVILARIIVLMTAIPVHEYAHAWAAERMGDPTARYRKRLSLNPLDHIDPIGALMILFIGIGFAKPVPINALNFRDQRKGIIVTSLAGPVSNIFMALAALIFYKLLRIAIFLFGWSVLGGFLQVLGFMVGINLTLAVFNLLPIPPLDGWHALSQVLPRSVYWKIAPYEHQILWIVLILVFMGFFTGPISLLTGLLYALLNAATFFLDILFSMVI